MFRIYQLDFVGGQVSVLGLSVVDGTEFVGATDDIGVISALASAVYNQRAVTLEFLTDAEGAKVVRGVCFPAPSEAAPLLPDYGPPERVVGLWVRTSGVTASFSSGPKAFDATGRSGPILTVAYFANWGVYDLKVDDEGCLRRVRLNTSVP